MADHDIQIRIDEISARMSDTIVQIEKITKEVLESKLNVIRLEIEMLNDRITAIENNKKSHCAECTNCNNHCKCEINFLASDLFLPK